MEAKNLYMLHLGVHMLSHKSLFFNEFAGKKEEEEEQQLTVDHRLIRSRRRRLVLVADDLITELGSEDREGLSRILT
uniref:Uncharacterized protein n=1 Tax=Nelumbo nucifera TaxID=4432 RepID=A0A822ZCB2_NELNU|nr:TPA_asm: hypothetical protein HUJ06_000403 [Nelumbo nucifera]